MSFGKRIIPQACVVVCSTGMASAGAVGRKAEKSDLSDVCREQHRIYRKDDYGQGLGLC